MRTSAHSTMEWACQVDDVGRVQIPDVERQSMAQSSAMSSAIWVACQVLGRVAWDAYPGNVSHRIKSVK